MLARSTDYGEVYCFVCFTLELLLGARNTNPTQALPTSACTALFQTRRLLDCTRMLPWGLLLCRDGYVAPKR